VITGRRNVSLAICRSAGLLPSHRGRDRSEPWIGTLDRRSALRAGNRAMGRGARWSCGLLDGRGGCDRDFEATATSALPANSLRSALGAARPDRMLGEGGRSIVQYAICQSTVWRFLLAAIPYSPCSAPSGPGWRSERTGEWCVAESSAAGNRFERFGLKGGPWPRFGRPSCHGRAETKFLAILYKLLCSTRSGSVRSSRNGG
jgi:hypothetical protein